MNTSNGKTLYCTTCCKEKRTNPQPLPALKRYVSERIWRIYKKSRADDACFRILSGKFGLLPPYRKIPFYDQALLSQDVPHISGIVQEQLAPMGVTQVVFFAKDVKMHPDWEPYYHCLYLSCMALGITFIFAEITDTGLVLQYKGQL